MNKKKNNIVGKAGVALVIFHMCRIGLDCVETGYNNSSADLWVRTEMGIKTIEVKTTSNVSWRIPIHQIERSDIYALVDLLSADVYLFSRDEILDMIKDKKQDKRSVSISYKQVPKCSRNNWKLFGINPDNVQPFIKPQKREKVPLATPRIERRTMADGTIKEYKYTHKWVDAA
jgi:hypothetical protein